MHKVWQRPSSPQWMARAQKCDVPQKTEILSQQAESPLPRSMRTPDRYIHENSMACWNNPTILHESKRRGAIRRSVQPQLPKSHQTGKSYRHSAGIRCPETYSSSQILKALQIRIPDTRVHLGILC